MKQLYTLTFLLAIIFMGCNALIDEEAQARAQRQQSFGQLDTLFSPIVTDTSSKFACSSLAFGAESPAGQMIGEGIMESSIAPGLLEKSLFSANHQHFALGKFPFSDTKVAYLVGTVADASKAFTHMYLYDLENQDFNLAHSLDYAIQGAGLNTRRDVWLFDMNQDQIRDIVYKLDFDYLSEDSTNTLSIKDSLRVEVWDGVGFANFRIQDMGELRSSLALQPLEDIESKENAEAGLDEFF